MAQINQLPNGLKSYLGSERYVTISQLKLKAGLKVHDLEIGSIEDCEFMNRKTLHVLKCQIITNEIESVFPGEIIDIPTNEMKRACSNNNIGASEKKRGLKWIKNNNS